MWTNRLAVQPLSGVHRPRPVESGVGLSQKKGSSPKSVIAVEAVWYGAVWQVSSGA